MNSPRLRLRDDVRLSLGHVDTTRFGSAITGLCDRLIQKVCRPIAGFLAHQRHEPTAEQSTDLMARCLGPGALGALYQRPEHLREDCLYPRFEAVRPVSLIVDDPTRPASSAIPLAPSVVPQLARWIGEWSAPARAPRALGAARSLWDALRERGALTQEPLRAPLRRDGITMVGHATVCIQYRGRRVLVDPFLLPPAHAGGEGMRPLTPAQLAPDAVFITHSHPDHYDPGSLLRLGADTPIYVPVVERESLLAIDMRARLRALGFSRVYPLAWGEVAQVGPLRVDAHPFWGEQPTDGESLHPEARNAGNVYVVNAGEARVALVADAGRDHAGSCLQLAERLRRTQGPVDVVLGGYRAWTLRPIRLLGTSVARYMLLVPRSQWGRRMTLMNDADDLLQMAAAWGAPTVVPYANGGAPWFWEAGLGPRPGSTTDDPNFDPSAEQLTAARQRRATQGHATPQLAWLDPSQRLSLPATPRCASPLPLAM